jgi:hypothetical protein
VVKARSIGTPDADHRGVDVESAVLRQIVRQRMEAGELPRSGTDRCWAGKGGGGLCSVCDQPIHPADNEYEIVMDEGPSGASSLLFHRRCLDVWIAECRRGGE